MARSLSEVLKQIRPNIRKGGGNSNNNSIFSPYPVDANKLGPDGTDHINVSPYAKTEIGQALANEVAIEVRHSVFGRFKSITGFWYYIKSQQRDDRCRKLIGKSLKDFSRGLTLSEVKNFRAIILDTVWQKINQHQEIKNELVKTDLQFECYFEDRNTGLRQRPNYFAWFIEGLTELRAAAKEDREPNLNKFLDESDTEIYQFVLPPKKEEVKQQAEEVQQAPVEQEQAA